MKDDPTRRTILLGTEWEARKTRKKKVNIMKTKLTVELVEKNGSIDRKASVEAFKTALDERISSESAGLEGATTAATQVFAANPGKRLSQDFVAGEAVRLMDGYTPENNGRYVALVKQALKNTAVFSSRRAIGTCLESDAATIDAQ